METLRLLNLSCCKRAFDELYNDNYFTYVARLYYETDEVIRRNTGYWNYLMYVEHQPLLLDRSDCICHNKKYRAILKKMLESSEMLTFVDINHKNKNGCNTLLYVIATGDIELFAKVIEHSAYFDLDPNHKRNMHTIHSLDLPLRGNEFEPLLYRAIKINESISKQEYFLLQILNHKKP